MPSRNPSRPCRVHSSVFKRPCRRFFVASGLPSRSAYPLPYLSFLFVVVCLLAPSYTQPIDCANRDSETLLKPLQTLAFIGVLQPHDGDTKTADTTATATARHGHTQGRHGHVTTATPRHGYGHDVTTTATTGTDMIAYKERARAIPHDTPKHNRTNIRANRRSIEHMYQCCTYDKPPGGGVSPRVKKPGPLAL